MIAKVEIDAGICGFRTRAQVICQDGQYVSYDIQSDCEKIGLLGDTLKNKGVIDAYQEINPNGESVVLSTARSTLRGCCAGCIVPVGLFKAMQVSAGLALPRDIHANLSKE